MPTLTDIANKPENEGEVRVGRTAGRMIAGMALCAAAALPAQTTPLTTTSVFPSRNSHTADRGVSVVARLSEALDATTIDPSSLVVHSSQTNHITDGATWSAGGTADSAALKLKKRFFPGEQVEATLTPSIRGIGGAALAQGNVFRFRTKAGSGPADFDRDSIVYDKGTQLMQSDAVTVGDLNGDGHLDIAALMQVSNPASEKRRLGLKLYFNDGFGAFTSSPLYPIGEYAGAIDLGDVDDDGDLDVVVGIGAAAAGQGRLLLYENYGPGVLIRNNIPLPSTQTVMAVKFGDMNGDGRLDIVTGTISGSSKPGSGSVILLGDGQGGFAAPFVYRAVGGVMDIALVDLDNDGDLDIVSAAMGNGKIDGQSLSDSIVYLNVSTPATGLSFVATKAFSQEGIWRGVDAGDLDGDGFPDVVLVGDGTNQWFRNDGQGGMGKGIAFGTAAVRTMAVKLGDMDGDGDLDIVVADLHLYDVWKRSAAYKNDGAGNFQTSVEFGSKEYGKHRYMDLALGDMDGDGDLDIVVAEADNQTKTLFRNGDPNLQVASPALPNAWEGVPYAFSLAAANGSAPYQWSLSPTNPGGWLSLEAATGVLSGTPPSGSANTTLTVAITVRDNGGSGATHTRSYTVGVNAVPTLPFYEDFEQTIARYSTGLGRFARAAFDVRAARGGASGLLLDGAPARSNWSLEGVPGAPGKAAADDPARWPTVGADHQGMFEWVLDGAGASELEVQFDYKIAYVFQPWHANALLEWSDDLGATWNVAHTNATTTKGVLRGDAAGSGATWKNASYHLQGIRAIQPLVRFRLRWITKLSADDAGAETYAAVDNLSVFLPGQPFAVTPNALPNALEGIPVAETFDAIGGAAPYVWTASGLPSWLSFNPGTRTLSGIPPSGIAPLSVTFPMTATDARGVTSSRPYTLNIVGAVQVSTSTVPEAVEGQAYGPITLERTGGRGPFSWSVAAGSMPPGLLLDGKTGSVSGIPDKGSAGRHRVSVEVLDNGSGQTDRGDIDIIVLNALPLVNLTTTLGSGQGKEYQPFSATIQVSGGIAPYTFSAIGSLPSWMNVDARSGSLSGTPQRGDSRRYSLGIIVTDSDVPAKVAVQNYLLDILPGPLPTFSSGPGVSAAGAGCALMPSGIQGWGEGWALRLSMVGILFIAYRRRNSLRRVF